MKKQIANIITSSRIFSAICLLFCRVFSVAFYVFYLFCGITDMVDGTIARKTDGISEFGAKLDTVADLMFLTVCFIKVLPSIYIPLGIWIWIMVIAIVKIKNIYLALFYNKKTILLHSFINKFTGFLLFLFPLTVNFIEPMYSSVVICFLATLATIKECYYIRADKKSS